MRSAMARALATAVSENEEKVDVLAKEIGHLNLHKTFCIPHGRRPRVGPVAVREHLAAYLPGHPLAEELPEKYTVSSAPYGSASIRPSPGPTSG